MASVLDKRALLGAAALVVAAFAVLFTVPGVGESPLPPGVPSTTPGEPEASPLRAASPVGAHPNAARGVPEEPAAPPSPATVRGSGESEADLIAEGELMTELRELRVRDPERALLEVRAAEERFPGGAGAAERGWIAARSLTALGRHEEAQAEARRLLAEHPQTHWARDAERHLLVVPLGLPSREATQRAAVQGSATP